MEMAFNALFFTDDYIEKRTNLISNQNITDFIISNSTSTSLEEGSNEEASIGFFFTFIEEFYKSLQAAIIPIFIVKLLDYILDVPKKYLAEYNEALKTEKDEVIILY